MTEAHQAEINRLRERISELEAQLAPAATSASPTGALAEPRTLTVTLAPPGDRTPRVAAPAPNAPAPAVTPAAVTPASTPAIVSSPTVAPAPTATTSAIEDELDEIDPFAEAWTSENSTFEERFAAHQFFSKAEPDQKARKWFLGD